MDFSLLPEPYIDNMKLLLKQDDFCLYQECFGYDYKAGLRANLLKIAPDDLYELLKDDLNITKKVAWCDIGFYYNHLEYKPAKNFYYNAGLFYIQEPSAMSVGAVLPIEKDDKVLDLCSAPGGKTTHIASKLNNTGLIVANDISNSRCKAIIKNIELMGITNTIITNETPTKLATKFNKFFNKIVVDAPCSGEGMFRKDKDSIKNWEDTSPDTYHNIQLEILDNAKNMLVPDGIIIYSTCTFSPIENEETILKFLNANIDFELIEFDKKAGFDDGQIEWINKDLLEISDVTNINNIKKAGRLFPYKVEGEGHFLALLKRKDNNNINISSNNININNKVNKKLLDDFYDFVDNNININNNIIKLLDNLYIHNNSLFSVPENLDFSKIRVVRSGFYWGELKKNRFEPSQALAMALKPEDFKNKLIFDDIKDENVLRYFKGESFVLNNNNNLLKLKDGWCLVVLNKYPIGFGKIQKGRLKNKYCVGWKI